MRKIHLNNDIVKFTMKSIINAKYIVITNTMWAISATIWRKYETESFSWRNERPGTEGGYWKNDKNRVFCFPFNFTTKKDKDISKSAFESWDVVLFQNIKLLK